jgi:tRNA threonylcarbamoyladenosine biosynthesis protein TsaB
MVILGIETSSSVCGLALSDANEEGVKPIAQIGLNIPNAHSEKIMTLLDALLQNAGLDKKNIRGIAVSIGPGSFTGLRIGLSTAKGLAFGLEIPVIGVPTLDVIAEKARFFERPVVVATASRRNEFYFCSYLNGERQIDYLVVSGEELVFRLKSGDILICDTAETLMNKIPSGVRLLDKIYSYPDSYFATVLGYKKLSGGNVDALDTLAPMYVQGFRGSKP